MNKVAIDNDIIGLFLTIENYMTNYLIVSLEALLALNQFKILVIVIERQSLF